MELKLRKWLRYHLIFSLVWKAIVFPLESQDTNWSQWNAFRFVNIKAKVIKAFLSKKPICPGHENCNRTEAETEKKRHVRWERAKIRINPFAGRSVGVLNEVLNVLLLSRELFSNVKRYDLQQRSWTEWENCRYQWKKREEEKRTLTYIEIFGDRGNVAVNVIYANVKRNGDHFLMAPLDMYSA